jgi:predicted nicotinamide N-methyase
MEQPKEQKKQPQKEEEERWIEFEACRTVNDDEEEPNFDIFGDPDPYETFSFSFTTTSAIENPTTTSNDDNNDDNPKRDIKITLKGYKHEHERIFDSTGLTLWRASRILCDYMCSNADTMIQNKNVLELGSGLGLCGLLAYYLHAKSVVMTDGDTDVLAEMRYNVDCNLNTAIMSTSTNNDNNNNNGEEANKGNQSSSSSNEIIPCQQLRWGKKYLDQFKNSVLKKVPTTEVKKGESDCESESTTTTTTTTGTDCRFDVIIASDVIYVDYILDDLFDTIVGLLSPSQDAKCYIAYARRAVDISLVFDCAERHGLTWTKPDDDVEGVYVFTRVLVES